MGSGQLCMYVCISSPTTQLIEDASENLLNEVKPSWTGTNDKLRIPKVFSFKRLFQHVPVANLALVLPCGEWYSF